MTLVWKRVTDKEVTIRPLVDKQARKSSEDAQAAEYAEMEKRADTADISVLFFLWMC